eukprot:Tamp_18697.p2 GENE.Tamp_18697~~Tamp_18697.p2  ORF type:complete len:155 (+),score=18.37 Tamp_18697:612-1076(+)
MAYLCSGYVLSNRLVSDLIAQITENPEMHDVLKEILTPLGPSIYIRDVSEYVRVGEEGALSFWDVALRAKDRGQVAMGYKARDVSYVDMESGTADFTLLNPPEKRRPRTWERGDTLVVIAASSGMTGSHRQGSVTSQPSSATLSPPSPSLSSSA